MAPEAPLMGFALALVLLAARRRGAAAVVALALLVASPRCTDDAAPPPAADVSLDVDTADTPDAAPDVEADVVEPDDLEAFFAERPAWAVVRWETAEEPPFPAAYAVELPKSGDGTLRLLFQADGTLRRIGTDGAVDFGCSASGTWEADGAELTLRWHTTPVFCPSSRPALRERLLAQVTGDQLTLTLVESPSTLGVTGRSLAPYRMVLAPVEGQGPAPDACAPLPEPAGCTLTCALEGEGLGRVPVYELGCGTGAPACTVVLDEARGRVVERTCTDGCHVVTCTVEQDETGGCELLPGGATCTY
jgi:hypothetical protein